MQPTAHCHNCDYLLQPEWTHCPRCGSATAPVVAEVIDSRQFPAAHDEVRDDTRFTGMALMMLGTFILLVGLAALPRLLRAPPVDGFLTIVAIVSGLAFATISIGYSLSTTAKPNPVAAAAYGLLGGLMSLVVIMGIVLITALAAFIALIATCFDSIGPQ